MLLWTTYSVDIMLKKIMKINKSINDAAAQQ